jgi:hypothetical protein
MIVRPAQHLREQLRPGEHVPRVLGEEQQQIELAPGEVHRILSLVEVRAHASTTTSDFGTTPRCGHPDDCSRTGDGWACAAITVCRRWREVRR